MMGKFIEVYDDIISQNLQNKIENFVFSSKINWGFNKNISNVPKVKSIGFANSFYSIDPANSTNFDTCFFFFQILYSLALKKEINIINVLGGRIFLQPPSINPRPLLEAKHTDTDYPHLVCLYYVNDSDGDTLFFDNNGNEIKKVSPKKGRIVFFEGSISHCGSEPSKLRSIINFNFIGEKL